MRDEMRVNFEASKVKQTRLCEVYMITQTIVQHLFASYCDTSPDMQMISTALRQKGIENLVLDHFAVIDLPGPHSGIPVLCEIFSGLGYEERGRDYLREKQNDFLWMAKAGCQMLAAEDALPQVVAADFRLDEMPPEISNIIYHYSSQASSTAAAEIRTLMQRGLPCTDRILQYFAGRDWPLPRVKEFQMVQEFNELLAWVLIFGRRPNHFSLSIHLLEQFADLADFHHFVEHETKLTLNEEGGKIKGGIKAGIAQGSTMGISQQIQLADGEVQLPTGFAEFVYRYPLCLNKPHQGRWGDYFTGFIARHADRVIESLQG